MNANARHLDQFARRESVGSECGIRRRRWRRLRVLGCMSGSRMTRNSSGTGGSRQDMAPCTARWTAGLAHHTTHQLPHSAHTHTHTHTHTRTRTTSSAHAPHIVSAILTCNSADAEIARHASRFEFDEFDEFRTSFLALPVAVARSQMVPFDLPNALS